MRIIITEEQFNRFNKSTPALQNGIIKYLNLFIKDGKRKINIKSQSFGNLGEEWCINGKERISARYSFDKGRFSNGWLFVDKELVETIQSIFSVRKSFVLHVIEEWYDDVMVPKFKEIMGEPELSIDKIDVKSDTHECIPEPVKPEGITDEEMIDFIDKNTAYRRQEIIDKLESGERELEDFYLDIVNTVNRKRITGF